MRVQIAVISDIHANLDALKAVLASAGGLETYCLGDLVDYGAEPNEVIDLVRDNGIRCIQGNHDSAAVSGETSMFNARAAISSVWTRRKLRGENLELLRALPLELKLGIGGIDAYFVHGSPDDKLWEYVDPRTHSDLFGYYLDRAKARMMGMGHTHVPYVWRDGRRIVFNPGSVGQPRDGDSRASFAVVRVEGGALDVEIRRVPYDVESAASKIIEAGLPESFARRLYTGD